MKCSRKVTTTPCARKAYSFPSLGRGGAFRQKSVGVVLDSCQTHRSPPVAPTFPAKRTHSPPEGGVALFVRKVTGWLTIGEGWLHWQFGDNSLQL